VNNQPKRKKKKKKMLTGQHFGNNNYLAARVGIRDNCGGPSGCDADEFCGGKTKEKALK
jgi:hypothetical protein